MQSNLIHGIPVKECDNYIASIIHKQLSKKTLRRMKRLNEYQDLKSEAWLGFCEASKRFDPSHGASFTTFAYMYVVGYVLNYLKKKKTRQGDFMQSVDELHESHLMTPISEIIEEPFDCVDELQKKEFLDFIINKISNKTARQIVHDHVLGKQTYRQIAKKHGMSHENARKILKREFLKLKNSLADENTVAN